MSLIDSVIIVLSIVCIALALTVIICLCDKCMNLDPDTQACIIFAVDWFVNQVQELGENIFNNIFCCCRTINRTVIPGHEPIPIREIELTEMVIVSNPLGDFELGSPSEPE